MKVTDRTTEIGVTINNILTALVLMVMSWVGLNINTMKTDISEIKGDSRVLTNEVGHIKDRLRNHIKEHKWRDQK